MEISITIFSVAIMKKSKKSVIHLLAIKPLMLVNI